MGDWQVEKRTSFKKPNYVEAKLVKIKPKAKKLKPKKSAPRVDLKKKKAEEAAKKRATQKAKDKARKEADARAKNKAEQKKREEEQRKKELAKEKALEQQRLQQRLQELAMAEAFAEEEAEMVAEESAEIAASYEGIIRQRIEANWSRPPSARNDMKAELSIQLVPTGKVVNVTVTKSSGYSEFDRSAEQAVRKAESFPELKQMDPQIFEQYFRRFTLVFSPQDLRL
ncbi:MAG: cell envelope integrity protein TolA [Cellvibrionaceae bacterium]